MGLFTKKGAIGAFDQILRMKNLSIGKWIGSIPIIGVSFIAIGYAVVVGWILKYLMLALFGKLLSIDPSMYFGQFVQSLEPIGWHLFAVVITMVIMIANVSKGIERVNKIVMPGFFFIFFILMVRSVTLDNAIIGIKYLMVPNWSYLLQSMTWIMAMGQAFFTVSLSGATMLVYGSYISEKEDIPNSAFNIEIAMVKNESKFDNLCGVLFNWNINRY